MFRYPEGTHGRGSLTYTGPVPVLRVAGGAEEIAEQIVALALRPAVRLLDYPLELLASRFRSRLLARLLVGPLDRLGRRLLPQFPPHHRRELAVIAGLLGDERRVIRANTLFDLKNLQPWRLFGCSSIAPSQERSRTGGPLLGRNLDFFPIGYLHDYGLVTVYQPVAGRKFATVGYPGMIGCFSGMNDAGLAAVSHEVFGVSGRGFDPKGVPFALVLRRALETCSSVDAAESVFRATPRTTTVSVVLCDRHRTAVVELSPDAVLRREPKQGVTICVNHFLSPALATANPGDTFATVRRLNLLERLASSDQRLGVAELFAVLHATNMGPLTIQSMVFEPAKLKLYLCMGEGPATSRAPTELCLEPWFSM